MSLDSRKKSKAIKYLSESGKVLIRMGNNSNGELCVQVVLNIPITDLIKESLRGGV